VVFGAIECPPEMLPRKVGAILIPRLFVSDEARSNQKGVLVHCLAGVSRSVTITVAYLMYKMNLSLNDAFNLVRSRKANVAPNFHFMEQLYNFERELRASPGRGLSSLGDSGDSGDPASASLSPPPGSITTPDSGEYDKIVCNLRTLFHPPRVFFSCFNFILLFFQLFLPSSIDSSFYFLISLPRRSFSRSMKNATVGSCHVILLCLG